MPPSSSRPSARTGTGERPEAWQQGLPRHGGLHLFLDDNPRHAAAAGELLREVEQGVVTAVSSTLMLAELLVPLHRRGDARTAREPAREVVAMPHLELVPLDMAIATEAARLRGAYGARTPDAVHAATALASRADVLVSNDQRLRALAGEPISLWLFDDAAR